MQLDEAKEKFIQAWGILGSKWGINRTMAQVHALLLIWPESISADEIMEELNISRGNANMNIRALVDWGLVYKEFKSGERREYFRAEKDIWKVATQVIKERKRRELEPVKKMLSEVANIEGDTKETKAFEEMVAQMQFYTNQADKGLEALIKADENWFTSQVLNLMKHEGMRNSDE